MTRIESVAAQPDMAGRYRITFSDGAAMRLYKQTVQDFGLYAGRELSEDEFDSLTKAARQMSAKMRAVRIISAGAVSRRELQQRLVQKGEDAACAQQAVSWLEEMDLLDDAKTAQQIVSRAISKGYGLNRAKQMLYEKRIPKEYWQQALADYPEQTEYIAQYVANHLPDSGDPKSVKKVIDALIRKGHSYSAIRRVIDTDALED